MTAGANFDLTGKVALITGGSRGIGLAIAQAYAAAGARVVVASRKQAAVDEAAALIRAAGGDVLAIAAHTGEPAAAAALVEQAVAHFGGLDILVNNAATNPHFGPFLTAEDSHWDKILDVNVKGYFMMAQRAARLMVKNENGGSILNIASIEGISPSPMMAIYSMTKAAVIMLTNLDGARYRQQCRHLGADHFLNKTREFEKIIDTIMDNPAH